MTSTLVGQPGLLIPPGPAGWWNSAHVSGPNVLREEDGRWRLYAYGRDPDFDPLVPMLAGRTGVAVSNDGIHWEWVRGPRSLGSVLEPSDDPDRFDSALAGVSDVQKIDGVYWLWYQGGDQRIVELGPVRARGLQMRVGAAISRDGVHFVKLDGPFRGALFDVGEPGAWDAIFVAQAKVLREPDGSWKLYYHALEGGQGSRIGLAVSGDGLHWERVGKVLGPGEEGDFDERGVSSRCILKIDGQYVMFYEGSTRDSYYGIGLATSPDGIHWTKERGDEPGGAIFLHAPKGSGRWDSRAVGTPCVVPDGQGGYRMYYVGAHEVEHRDPAKGDTSSLHAIGLAVSDGPNLRRWRRWNEE